MWILLLLVCNFEAKLDWKHKSWNATAYWAINSTLMSRETVVLSVELWVQHACMYSRNSYNALVLPRIRANIVFLNHIPHSLVLTHKQSFERYADSFTRMIIIDTRQKLVFLGLCCWTSRHSLFLSLLFWRVFSDAISSQGLESQPRYPFLPSLHCLLISITPISLLSLYELWNILYAHLPTSNNVGTTPLFVDRSWYSWWMVVQL